MKQPSKQMKKALHRARLMASLGKTGYNVTFAVGLPPDRTQRIRVSEIPAIPEKILEYHSYLMGAAAVITGIPELRMSKEDKLLMDSLVYNEDMKWKK